MEIYCNGTAIITDGKTGAEYEIEADELIWEAVDGSDEPMGTRTHYEASVEHEHLGLLTWNLWEYPEGAQNDSDTDAGNHHVKHDFDYGLQHTEDLEEIKQQKFQDQVDRMVEWFLSMFEDPQNQTPYAIDKDSPYNYEYIWGGPYDARDRISDYFADEASEKEIDAAIEKVEEDGTIEWAPSHSHPDYLAAISNDQEAVESEQDFATDASGDVERRISSVEVKPMAMRVSLNREALTISIAGLLEQISEHRERVRGSNQLEENQKNNLLDFLDELSDKLNELMLSLPTANEKVGEDEARGHIIWLRKFGKLLKEKGSKYIEPENLAEAVIPTGIILVSTGIGAMLGMPLPGVVVGGLITNQIKPGKAAEALYKPENEGE